MAESRLQFIIEAENRANAVFKQVNDQLDAHKDRLKDISEASKKVAAVGAAAFATISAEVGLSLKAYADAEAQMAKVDSILKTLSKTTIDNAGGMDALKQKIDAVSKANIKMAFDDEDTAESLARLTQTTGNYDEALKLNAMAMDLARYKNVDLGTATTALMKVNSGSMKELKAMGIEVADNTTKEDAYRIILEKTAGQAAAYADTVKGKSEALKISFANLQEGIGGALQPAFQKLFDVLMPVIEKFADWAEKNPDLLAKIIMVAGAVAALIAVLGTIGMALPVITAAFTLLAGPVGLVILAITALIAIGVLLYKHWDEIKAKAIEIWTAISSFFSGVWQGISTTAQNIWNGIKDFFGTVWQIIKDIFTLYVTLSVGIVIAIFNAFGIDIVAVFKSIGDFFVQFWADLTAAWQWAITGLQTIWNTMWTAIKDFLGPIWESIRNATTIAFGWLKSKFNEWTEPLRKSWESLWSGLGGTVETVWENVKKTIKDSINWIIGKINSVINSINSVAAKGAGALGMTPVQIPPVPYLAQGGIVRRPTLAMIGESGPEAVVPLNKGYGSITINITGNEFLGEEGVADRIGRQIMNMLRTSVKI